MSGRDRGRQGGIESWGGLIPARQDEVKVGRYLGGVDLIKVLDQLRSLFEVTADIDNLLHVVVRGQFHRANVDLNDVSKEILRQVGDNAYIDNARKRTFASFSTSLGHVALSIRVCRSGRI